MVLHGSADGGMRSSKISTFEVSRAALQAWWGQPKLKWVPSLSRAWNGSCSSSAVINCFEFQAVYRHACGCTIDRYLTILTASCCCFLSRMNSNWSRWKAIALDQIASVLYSMRRPMEAGRDVSYLLRTIWLSMVRKRLNYNTLVG